MIMMPWNSDARTVYAQSRCGKDTKEGEPASCLQLFIIALDYGKPWSGTLTLDAVSN